jgi:hypothetical protein
MTKYFSKVEESHQFFWRMCALHPEGNRNISREGKEAKGGEKACGKHP